MNRYCRNEGRGAPFWYAIHLAWLLILSLLLTALPAHAAPASITLNVTDHAGAPVSGFRWLVEEDPTHPVTPGVHTTQTLSLTFHASHSPVVKQGEITGSSVVIDNIINCNQMAGKKSPVH